MTLQKQQKLVNQAQRLGFNLSALYGSTPWTRIGSMRIVRIHTKATKRYLRRLKQLEQLQNPLEDLTVNCATCKLSALDCVSCTLVEPITHLTYLPYLQNSAELAPPLDSAENNQEATFLEPVCIPSSDLEIDHIPMFNGLCAECSFEFPEYSPKCTNCDDDGLPCPYCTSIDSAENNQETLCPTCKGEGQVSPFVSVEGNFSTLEREECPHCCGTGEYGLGG